MSADNYITIRKEGKEYVGYMQYVSAGEDQDDQPLFRATSIKGAIKKAQAETTEYGYRFINLGGIK